MHRILHLTLSSCSYLKGVEFCVCGRLYVMRCFSPQRCCKKQFRVNPRNTLCGNQKKAIMLEESMRLKSRFPSPLILTYEVNINSWSYALCCCHVIGWLDKLHEWAGVWWVFFIIKVFLSIRRDVAHSVSPGNWDLRLNDSTALVTMLQVSARI